MFGTVEGYDIPLLANLLATEGRICRALGVRSADDLGLRITELIHPEEPEGWFERLTTAPARSAPGKLSPKSVKSGLCQQVVRLGGDIDLGELPAVQARPLEPTGTITAGQFSTLDPASGRVCSGRYDLRKLDRNRLLVGWHAHDDPARLLPGYGHRKAKMPTTIVLGGDPAGLLATMAVAPGRVDVASLSGLLRNKPREMVRCRTVDMAVPTDADLVLEGYVDPAEPPQPSGLVAVSGGEYQLSQPWPVMHVTAVTHRANPVFPAIVPGVPPDEACVIHRFLQRVFLPVVRLAIGELVDYDLPAFGMAHQAAMVSIRKDYAGQARRVAHSLWGMRQWMFTKLLVIVDEEIDVHDAAQVWSAVARHADMGRDVVLQPGPLEPSDSAAEPGELTTRMAIDATRKLPGERAALRPASHMPEEVRRRVTERWPELGLR